jgi:hypothetical protein
MKFFTTLAFALSSVAGIGLVVVASDALAATPSIIGQWKIVAAAPAPWARPDERNALAAQGKHLINLIVTFKPTSVKSKFKLFSCKRRVVYEPVELQVDALFQGNLPEPNPGAVARRMGFPRGDVPSVDVQCINAKFTFHFRDSDTALINLDRVIYTFKRQ